MGRTACQLGRFALGGLIGAVASCSSGPAAPTTINVPRDAPTIQAGVERARPGDLVLIEPGVYREKVLIETDRVVVRGRDRNAVILDGEYTRDSGVTVAADGVAIENLSVRNYNANGIFINGAYSPEGVDPTKSFGTGDDVVKGYRVSYVTSYNNGLYGIYAFAARGGTIEHSYASGHPDSGFYVGQCKPCNVVLKEITAERNAIGYFGTNASGGVVITGSTFRGNRLGLTPSSQKTERLAPQAETIIAANLIADNGGADAPNHPGGAFGLGVVIGGGTNNRVLRNRITGNSGAGVLITALDGYVPENNRVEANVLAGNGVDLFYDAPTDARTRGNCFTQNIFETSAPTEIERQMTCTTATTLSAHQRYRQGPAPQGPSHKQVEPPGSQPNMPDTTAAPAPAIDVKPSGDLSGIAVPSAG